VAALLGVAALGAIVVSVFNAQLQGAMSNSMLDGMEQQLILEQSNRLLGIQIPQSFSTVAWEFLIRSIRSAFVSDFRWAMGVSVVLAVTSTVISFFTIHNRSVQD
jgi:hypothetical protein